MPQQNKNVQLHLKRVHLIKKYISGNLQKKKRISLVLRKRAMQHRYSPLNFSNAQATENKARDTKTLMGMQCEDTCTCV